MSRSPRRASKVDSIRPTYGFDDVSLAPGVETIEPSEVDVSVELCGLQLRIPILAAAMDAVATCAWRVRSPRSEAWPS